MPKNKGHQWEPNKFPKIDEFHRGSMWSPMKIVTAFLPAVPLCTNKVKVYNFNEPFLFGFRVGQVWDVSHGYVYRWTSVEIPWQPTSCHKLMQMDSFFESNWIPMFPKACVDRLPGRMNAQESNVVEVLLPFWASWQLVTCPVLLPPCHIGYNLESPGMRKSIIWDWW